MVADTGLLRCHFYNTKVAIVFEISRINKIADDRLLQIWYKEMFALEWMSF